MSIKIFGWTILRTKAFDYLVMNLNMYKGRWDRCLRYGAPLTYERIQIAMDNIIMRGRKPTRLNVDTMRWGQLRKDTDFMKHIYTKPNDMSHSSYINYGKHTIQLFEDSTIIGWYISSKKR